MLFEQYLNLVGNGRLSVPHETKPHQKKNIFFSFFYFERLLILFVPHRQFFLQKKNTICYNINKEQVLVEMEEWSGKEKVMKTERKEGREDFHR
jgi:hypothetical protein